jgi:hypothetical protein
MHTAIGADRPKHLPRLTGGVAALLLAGFAICMFSDTRSISLNQLSEKQIPILASDLMLVAMQASVAAGMR